MERMDHSSPGAAMTYLHVSKGRSRHIADKLSGQLRAARGTDSESAGTDLMAREWHGAGYGQNLPGIDSGQNVPVTWGNGVVETRGLEPLTPALQRRTRWSHWPER